MLLKRRIQNQRDMAGTGHSTFNGTFGNPFNTTTRVSRARARKGVQCPRNKINPSLNKCMGRALIGTNV